MFARTLFIAPIVAAMLAAASLLGCGDDEATHRKAFIEFLQTRIINKPGLHVPKLTAEETASLGDYAKQYAVIADFNENLSQSVSKPMTQALEAGMPRSLDDVVTRRKDIAALEGGFAKLRTALDEQLASADAVHAALKQPADLKPVYDAAYDRDVTQPAKIMAEVFPDADAAMKAILALADFIADHPAIKVQGSMIQTSDPSLQRPLQALIDAVSAKTNAINNAQRKFNALVNG
jgi:hypothetical protein